jgi:predicted MFS family arabinose efflux permease
MPTLSAACREHALEESGEQVVKILAAQRVVASRALLAAHDHARFAQCAQVMGECGLRHRDVEAAARERGTGLSLNASAIYLGVGLSGVVGGAVLSGGGSLLLPEIAALLTAAGAAVVVIGWRARVRRPALAE